MELLDEEFLPADDGVDKVGPVYMGDLLLISNENPDCYSYENTGSCLRFRSNSFFTGRPSSGSLRYESNPSGARGLTLDKLVKLGDNFEVAAVGSTSNSGL